MVTEGWRVGSNVDDDIENRTMSAPDELCFLGRGCLKMEAPNDCARCIVGHALF